MKIRLIETLPMTTCRSVLRGVVTTGVLWILAWMPFAQLRAQEPTSPPERVEPSYEARSQRYPIGTAVEVQLHNKERISGRVEKYAGDGFWIRAEGARKNQKIFFFDLQSIHPRGNGQGAAVAGKQPGFNINLWIGGTGADVKVYRPGGGGPDESR